MLPRLVKECGHFELITESHLARGDAPRRSDVESTWILQNHVDRIITLCAQETTDWLSLPYHFQFAEGNTS